MEAFGVLAAKLTGALVTIATPIGLLWLGWGCLKALMTGGAERAVQTFLVPALIIGVLLAVLANLPTMMSVVTTIGAALFQTIVQSIQGAF
jgi:hypothetical protein